MTKYRVIQSNEKVVLLYGGKAVGILSWREALDLSSLLSGIAQSAKEVEDYFIADESNHLSLLSSK